MLMILLDVFPHQIRGFPLDRGSFSAGKAKKGCYFGARTPVVLHLAGQWSIPGKTEP